MERNEQVTIGTTLLKVAEANPNRNSIYFRNTSVGAQEITLVFSEAIPAIVNKGYVLKAGEYMSESATAGYNDYRGSITAIGNLAAGALTIVER